MIDVFGRELIVSSFDRSRVVTLDKFIGLSNSTHNTNFSLVVNSEAIHIGDVIVIHPNKFPLPPSKCLW